MGVVVIVVAVVDKFMDLTKWLTKSAIFAW